MGLACALNLASSAMVNGICCMYQMQEEEERQKANHEAIRRSIRIEYERNRQLDEEQRQRELREIETAARKTKFTEERRRKLMAKKFLSSIETRCISPCKQHRPSAVDESLSSTIHSSSGAKRRFDLVDSSANNMEGSSILLEKVRASVRVNNFIRQASRLSQQSSVYSDSPDMKTSSLLDSDDEFDDQDEEQEEEEEFEEIPIE